MAESIKRYLIKEEIQSKFTSFYSSNIKEYYGIDNFYNRPVKMKTFELPEKEEAKRLAITLWEREIRLIRKAMRISGGNFLLQLLDGYIDYDYNKLHIISSKFGKTLNEWMNESHKLWFFNETTPDARKEI